MTQMVERDVWYHHGVTWSRSNGLAIISDGVLVRNVPHMMPKNNTELTRETNISLGSLPRNPLVSEWMSEVAVDELYFWETWLPYMPNMEGLLRVHFRIIQRFIQSYVERRTDIKS